MTKNIRKLSIIIVSVSLLAGSLSATSISTIEELDEAAVFHFAIMSDNKGTGLENTDMARCDAWVRDSAAFIIGLGDHLVSDPDPFLDLIQNDPYWRSKFYPNIADGENQYFSGNQATWGSGKKMFNYVDDFWGRPNVIGQGNGVDYYAFFKVRGFTVHLISLHYSDSYDGSRGGRDGFIEESRIFMHNTLLGIDKGPKDIIVVVAHSKGGDFVKSAGLSRERKDLLFEKADLLCSATTHVFQRFEEYDRQYVNGAVSYNSGAVGNTGSTSGYMELHVLDGPPRLVIQYINLEQSSRELQTGPIIKTKAKNPTVPMIKEIGGRYYQFDWNDIDTVPPVVEIEVEGETQAEDHTAASDCKIATNKAGYTGKGFVNMGGKGSWFELDNIDGGAGGSYTLSFRYAFKKKANRPCEISVNGVDAGNVSFASTGARGNWLTDTIDVTLSSGQNTIRLTASTSKGGPNIDKMDVRPVMTAFASEENPPDETADKAFDGQADSKWLSFSPIGSWIQYKYAGGAHATVTKYAITSANDAPERDPKDWKLLGSNDGGVSWYTLDSRTGETFSSRFQKRLFSISSPGAYNIYRLEITAVRDTPKTANCVQLAEIELCAEEKTRDRTTEKKSSLKNWFLKFIKR